MKILNHQKYEKESCRVVFIHHGLDGSAFPSGLGYNVYDGFEMGDKQHAGWVSSIFGDDVRFSIYVPNKKQFVSYGPNSTIADFPEFWDFHSKK